MAKALVLVDHRVQIERSSLQIVLLLEDALQSMDWVHSGNVFARQLRVGFCFICFVLYLQELGLGDRIVKFILSIFLLGLLML